MKRYYIYFVLFIFMFFVSFLDVNADYFVEQEYIGGLPNICYNNDLNYVGMSTNCYPNHNTVVKKMNNTRAYCGNRVRSVVFGRAHIYDSKWANATSCGYMINNKVYKNGWCSEIMGFVINEARKGITNEAIATMRAQAAVWTYLWNFTYEDQWRSGNDNNAWRTNKTVRNNLINAFTNYSKAINTSSGSSSKSSVEDNIINISDNNVVLYYRPNDNSCGTGHYQSKMITIENKSGHNINFDLSHSVGTVQICSNNTCGGALKGISLEKGGKYKFYLKSSSMVRNADLSISVYAYYEETTNKNDSTVIYDSARYYVNEGNRSESEKNYQSIIIPKTSSIDKNKKLSIRHYTNKKIKFSYKGVVNKVCSSKNALVSGGSYYYPSNQQLNKKCANNLSDSELVSKKDEYTAKFSGCTCKVLDINGKKVRILVKENTEFIYGTFSPNSVYPGGGFGLARTKRDENNKIVPLEGVLTRYYINLTWDFSDYSDSVPYYFDADKGIGDNASTLSDEIVTKLKNDFSSGLDLNIATRDSNEGSYSEIKEKNDYKININFSDDAIEYKPEEKKFYKIYYVSLPKAYFSPDGKVSYSKSGEYSSDADNRYYVPTNYTVGTNVEQSFPFNITKSNLSLSRYFDFDYSAKCYEIVNPYDLNMDLSYRAISEKDPFPKYIPVNWIDWYNIPSNKNRLLSSFENYPDNPLYRISFSESEINRILNDNTVYTSWKNIDDDGSSAYVSNYFNKKANNSSYCKMGEFSSSCDK